MTDFAPLPSSNVTAKTSGLPCVELLGHRLCTLVRMHDCCHPTLVPRHCNQMLPAIGMPTIQNILVLQHNRLLRLVLLELLFSGLKSLFNVFTGHGGPSVFALPTGVVKIQPSSTSSSIGSTPHELAAAALSAARLNSTIGSVVGSRGSVGLSTSVGVISPGVEVLAFALRILFTSLFFIT